MSEPTPSPKTAPAVGQTNGAHRDTIPNNRPQHVAIIMDGNGRWAERKGLPRLEGHKAGTDNVHRILEAFERYNIKYVTLYAFSTENWNRPVTEVEGLMALLEEVVIRETENLREKNVRLRCLGRTDRLSPSLTDSISKAVEATRDNDGLNLNVAVDYGGRDEIVQAVRRIVQAGVPPEQVTERLVHHYLYTGDLPDPDLIIRTGGEQRLSNFLTWQSVYSEYYYSTRFWPDFDEDELDRVLLEYSQRRRRFGALDAEG